MERIRDRQRTVTIVCAELITGQDNNQIGDWRKCRIYTHYLNKTGF